MYELRFIYKDGTCAVWSNIINVYISTEGIYFTKLNVPNNTHFVSWNKNIKSFKVVKK